MAVGEGAGVVDEREAIRDGGGALLDLGIYPLSFASLCLGGVTSAAGLGSLTDRGVDRRVAFVVQGPSGAVASCATDMSVSSPTTASVNGTWARLELETQFYTPTTMRLVGADGDPRRIIDVQWRTPHLGTLGVVEVHRREYLTRLEHALQAPALDLAAMVRGSI